MCVCVCVCWGGVGYSRKEVTRKNQVCVCVGEGWGRVQQEGGDTDVSRVSGKNNKVDSGAVY